MRRFTALESIAAPLLRDDIDSDQILPGAYLRGFKPDYATGLFAFWRQDKNFILNRPGYEKAGILVVGRNFGCGSTREQAIWALERFGIRVVVGLSFAEVFRENLIKNGILPIGLDEEAHASVVKTAMRLAGTAPMTVDLFTQTIAAPGASDLHFELAPVERTALLEGLDEIGMTLREMDAIAAYEADDRSLRPWRQSFNKNF